MLCNTAALVRSKDNRQGKRRKQHDATRNTTRAEYEAIMMLANITRTCARRHPNVVFSSEHAFAILARRPLVCGARLAGRGSTFSRELHRTSFISNAVKLSSGKDHVRLTSAPRQSSNARHQLREGVWARLKSWSQPYLALSRIDKPIGTWLLFWPCAWSITLASHTLGASPSIAFANLALFGTGALVMRGAGCTINDMWDSKMDKLVERTRSRPLASGAINHFQALSFLGLQLSVGLGVLVNLNWYSILLGASSLSVVTIYPLMKRITYWPQAVLGLAFNWGALLGWSAVAGHCDWSVVLPLYAGSFCWTLVYDTIYAHQDKSDDVTAGVKSTALLFGSQTKPVLAGFSTSFLALLTYSVSQTSPLLPMLSNPTHTTAPAVLSTLSPWLTTGHPLFLLSLAPAALHLARQVIRTDLDNVQSCWKAFCSNRNLGFIVWSGLLGDYLVQVALPQALNALVVIP